MNGEHRAKRLLVFFQAEDGIRDADVTGVQTCALPISYVLPVVHRALAINPQLKIMASPWSPPGWMKTTGSLIQGTLRPEAYGRSEERRVGKECRSRWSPYH